MRLFICEKPSQARDIANAMDESFDKDEGFLKSSNTIITWCFGHLLELAPPDDYCDNLGPWRLSVLPVLPDEWRLKPQPKTKKQLNIIGRLLKKASSVVIATDADREGDVIGREVLDYFSYSGGVERLWLSALDEASVKTALNDIRPGESTKNLYQAGLGRSRADWLVGMNLTMATSSLFATPGQGVLSVGRVQTPTLKLVVDRDNEIDNFKPKNYFVLKAQFKTKEHEAFWMRWDIAEALSDNEGRCINQSLISQVANEIKNGQGVITQFSEIQKSQNPPLCLSLSSLQKIASAKYGYGAKETLDIAQALYEKHKATTYPRTDCGYLPESQFAQATQILIDLGEIDASIKPLLEKTNASYKSKAWNDNKVSAHHGIIPTLNSKVNITAMSDKEFKLYDIVRRYYMGQFLGTYDYMARSAVCVVYKQRFIASQNTPVHFGFKLALADFNEGFDDKDIDETTLPKLEQGAQADCVDTDIQSKITKPPARFSEGTLITAMKSIAKYVDDVSLKKVLKETAGIGTEATRANILETLINREYVTKKGRQIISSEKGRELIKLLPDSITNPATTAIWEQELDNIAEGKSDINDFLDEQADTLEGMIEQLEKLSQSKSTLGNQAVHPCPDCQKPMVKRKGKKGHWWGCSGYPECRLITFDAKGKPDYKNAQKKL